MRLLKRNRQRIYYALYQGKEPIKDEYGNETGEYKLIYSDPIPLEVSISAARGESSTTQFGALEDYDRVIITDDMMCPINEHSILWIDNLDPNQKHDYIVKRVAKSLNFISYAVKKVKVND